MSLTFALVVAVSVTLAFCLGQLFFGDFSLFAVGATLLVVSAACSAIDFLHRTARAKQDAGTEDIHISQD